MPAGVGAVTTAPGTYGFAALFLLSGAMELAVWTQASLCAVAGWAGKAFIFHQQKVEGSELTLAFTRLNLDSS